MTIDSSGNVGIGASAPRATLDVRGGHSSTVNEAISFGRTDDNYRYNSIYSFNTSLQNSYLSFRIHDGGSSVAQTETMVLKPGKVGIGTSSPSTNLTVVQSGSMPTSGFSATQWVGAFVNTGTTTSIARVGIYSGNATDALLNFGDADDADIGGLSYSNAENSLAIRTNNAEHMRIKSDGKVGIGTTAPQGMLHVADSKASGGDLWTQIGAGNAPSIHIQNTGNAANTNAVLYFRNSSAEKASIGARFVNQSTGETELRFGTTNSSGSSLERMVLTGAGNVGIGTTAPLGKLSVGAGSINDAGLPVQISTGADGTQAWYAVNRNGSYGALFGYSANSTYKGLVLRNVVSSGTANADGISFMTNNTSMRMHITGAGNVGIGTNSPTQKLHIAGGTLVANSELQITSSASYTTHLNYNNTGDNYISFAPSGQTAIRDNNGTKFVVYSSSIYSYKQHLFENSASASTPGIAFNGDTNTGLYRPSSDNLGFAIGGTARAFMSNTQFNVAAKIVATELDINGNADVSGTLTVGTFAPTNIAITSGTVKLDGDFPTGSRNVALGDEALQNVSGSYNTAIGSEVLKDLSSGNNNTAVGRGAGENITTGIDNILIGSHAGGSLTDSDYNTAIGMQALKADTLGSRSVAVGRAALYNQNFTYATNAYNTAVGFNAGLALTTGQQNVFIGGVAGDAITTGSYNTAVGTSALSSATTGAQNAAFGQAAGAFLTTGSYNTFIGDSSGLYLTTGGSNVALGQNALRGDTGGSTVSGITAIGRQVFQNITTGVQNTGLGYQAGLNVTSGGYNTLIGYVAGDAITTGGVNTAVGALSLTSNNGE